MDDPDARLRSSGCWPVRRAPDDTGAADPRAGRRPGGVRRRPGPRARRARGPAEARLLVPVVAVLGEAEVGPDGLVRDKSSDMGAVLMRGADGRTALLAFTSLDAMHRWDPDARPVPVPAQVAAQAALQDGAAALLIDVAGPVRFVSRSRRRRRWLRCEERQRRGWAGPPPIELVEMPRWVGSASLRVVSNRLDQRWPCSSSLSRCLAGSAPGLRCGWSRQARPAVAGAGCDAAEVSRQALRAFLNHRHIELVEMPRRVGSQTS